jgi:hypothetical protein
MGSPIPPYHVLRRLKLLATRQYIFELPAKGRSVAGLWAIGTGIAVMIVMTALLVAQVE